MIAGYVAELHTHGDSFVVNSQDQQSAPDRLSVGRQFRATSGVLNNFSAKDRQLPMSMLYGPKAGLMWRIGDVEVHFGK